VFVSVEKVSVPWFQRGRRDTNGRSSVNSTTLCPADSKLVAEWD